MLNYPPEWISEAKSAGCHGFSAKGTITLAPVKAWIDSNLETLMANKGKKSLRDQKLEQEIRRLRHANEKMEASLVSRAWLRERFERIGAEIAALAERSVIEDTAALMAAGPDIARIRAEYRKVWDRIMIGLQNCADHLCEE